MKFLGLALVCGLILVGCSKNNSENDTSQTSTAQSTAQSTVESETVETSSSEGNSENPYAVNEITDTQFPKKGDYSIQDGVQGTFLTDLIDIEDYSTNGLVFTNTQYNTMLLGPLHPEEMSDMFYTYEDTAKALFDESHDDIFVNTYAVILSLETDIENTSDETLRFDSFSGYMGGEYDWIIPGNKQIDRQQIIYQDASSIEVQAGTMVEDIPFMILLSTGSTPEDAVNKIPQGQLTIKTAGVSTLNYDQLGGERTINLDLPE